MKVKNEVKIKTKNEGGYAAVEAVVFLVSFSLMAIYAIDYFSAIQTGILGSIHARAYLFETLRHRANIDYLRYDRATDPGANHLFANDPEHHERVQTIVDESPSAASNNTVIPAVGRIITQADEDMRDKGNLGTQNKLGFSEDQKTSTIYVKSAYGICTDSQCTGN